MKVTSKNFYIIFSVTAFFFLAVYFPIFSIHFINHDDVRFWSHIPGGSVRDLTLYYLLLGRYLAAGILYLYDLYVVTISDLSVLRFVTVLAVIVSASLLIYQLVRLRFHPIIATSIGVGLLLVPGVQIGTQWLMTSPSIFALIPAMGAGIVLSHSNLTKIWDIYAEKARILLCAGLLFASIILYTASATAIFIPIILMVLFGKHADWSSIRLKAVLAVLMYFALMVIFYLLHKSILSILLDYGIHGPGRQDAFAFTLDLLPKLDLFINHISILALNIWSVEPKTLVSTLVISIALVGFALFCFRAVRSQSTGWSIKTLAYIVQFVLLITVIIFVSNTHNIVPVGGIVTYRTTITYSMIIGALVFWSIIQINNFLKAKSIRYHTGVGYAVILLLIATLGLLTQDRLLFQARNLNAELLYIRTKINEHLSTHGNIAKINFIQNDYSISPAYLGIIHPWSELRYSSNAHEWSGYVNAIFAESVAKRGYPIVCYRSESYRSCPNGNRINTETISYDKTSASNASEVLTINLNNLLPFKKSSINILKKHSLIDQIIPTITSSSTGGNYGPKGLWFGAQPGWHAESNPAYPQFITIDFKSVVPISELLMLPQDRGADRMPKSVNIEVSNNGFDFQVIDTFNDICTIPLSEDWYKLRLNRKVETRFLRVRIKSNCGHPNLLTLRGIYVR